MACLLTFASAVVDAAAIVQFANELPFKPQWQQQHVLCTGIASPIANFVLRPMGLIQFAFVFVAGWALQAEKLLFFDVLNGLFAATAIAGSLVVFTVIATAWPIKENTPNNCWQKIIKANETGPSELLKDSIYVGTVAADGSPVLVDRSLLLQHVHFLGSTGSGKTSMGLGPLVEQIIRNGKSSVIMLNLKGKSLEGYSAMVTAQQELLARTGQSIPIKVFSLENGVRTHIFNPLLSPAWRRLSEVEQSEVLNNAYGLNFGQSYGAKWFGDSAAEFSLTSLLANPNTISFRNLLVEAQRILKSSRAGELPPEVKRAGIHAWLLTKRMAAVDALNLTQSPLDAPDALEHQIDLTKCFSSPQLCYFNPTELISIGALAAGLLGVPQPVEPELGLLASWMRLYIAFKHHTNGGVDPTNWRKMGRQHFLSGLAAIAVVSTSNSTSKKLVAAPTAMSSVKLNRFIDQLNSMQVQYELW